MPPPADGKIYSATYSNVPVYEYNVAGTAHHVMRRRADDWINATHILKVAGFDKPARTRILEREVQKGIHEKVQGGYGKYQGTWVPLLEGRVLAERNQVLDKLLPILDYVPGDRSPPPAPKHATAGSSRPKVPRVSAAAARRTAFIAAQASQLTESQAQFDDPTLLDPALHDPMLQAAAMFYEDTPDNETIISESQFGDPPDMMDLAQHSVAGRKRKRESDQMSKQDRDHQIWADALLDYFMLIDHEEQFISPPEPPSNVNLDRAIDEKGHTAMHWAAAMGDVDVVKELLQRGARTDCVSNNLETPLMRAVMFTNNFDKNTMPSMIKILQSTVVRTDWFGSTVFHHIAATTQSASKFVCARYYMDCIINKLSETWIPEEINRLLNTTDKNGDTALHIAARHGARKLVRSLLGRNVALDIVNNFGETVDDLIRSNRARRIEQRQRQASSSPFGSSAPPPPLNDFDMFDADLEPFYAMSFTDPNFQEPPMQYNSQTAQNMVNKVAPTLEEKCRELATAYDMELQDKEMEAEEGELVVKKRQAELEAIRKQTMELISTSNDMHIELEDDESEECHQNEFRALTEEAETLLELEQSVELRRLRNAISTRNHASAIDLLEKARYAYLLHVAQIERRELVKEVVANLAVAGASEQQNIYKTLIAKAIGEREEDVEEMLPEMLRELEEAETQERAEGLEDSPL